MVLGLGWRSVATSGLNFIAVLIGRYGLFVLSEIDFARAKGRHFWLMVSGRDAVVSGRNVVAGCGFTGHYRLESFILLLVDERFIVEVVFTSAIYTLLASRVIVFSRPVISFHCFRFPLVEHAGLKCALFFIAKDVKLSFEDVGCLFVEVDKANFLEKDLSMDLMVAITLDEVFDRAEEHLSTELLGKSENSRRNCREGDRPAGELVSHDE